jgi:hypothetical protein
MRKTIVTTLPDNHITLDDLKREKEKYEDHTYIVYDDVAETVGWITRPQFDAGNYSVACPQNITNGNSYGNYKTDDLSEMLEELKRDNWTIEMFDNSIEAFEFVVEKLKQYEN